jgi:hypothetical protein
MPVIDDEERHYRATRSEIAHRKLFLIMQSVSDKNNWGVGNSDAMVNVMLMREIGATKVLK